MSNDLDNNIWHPVMSDGHTSDRPAHSRDLASDIEVLELLLNTLTDFLDIREVFDHVSQAVQRILPHDLLGVMEISESGDRIHVLALAGRHGLPRDFETPVLEPDYFTKPWDVKIIDDISSHEFFSRGPAAKAGMKSVITVPVRFGGRLRAAVNFFSLENAHFSHDDLLVAQRTASFVPFAMSHHRLPEEARLTTEANARASRLESRVQQLTDELDARTGHRRVIGESPQ